MAWVIQSGSEYRTAQRRLQSLGCRIEKNRAFLLEAGAASSEVETALKEMKDQYAELADELNKYENRTHRRKKP